MAISNYKNETGETLWSVYVNVRSKENPNIRAERKAKGLKTEKEAGREETRLIRECEREILGKESRGSSWGAVVEAFEKYFNSPLSESASLTATTRDDYLAMMRKHTFSWWPRPAAEISKSDLREFIAYHRGQGLSISHLRKMKTMFNKIFEYGIERRLIRGIDQSPTVGLQLGKAQEKTPEILTLSEIRRLLVEARKVSHEWYPVWALALLTGCRNGELYALLWSDIDFENNSMTISKSYNCRLKSIKCTKAGCWRSVPISSELKSLLMEIKLSAADRKSVLPRFSSWSSGWQARELRKFCIGIGITSIKFHALRACLATQLIRNGIAPIQIQKICGWKDLKTMQRYIRLAGIEITGATEVLKVLPEINAIETAGALFNGAPALQIENK